MKNYELLELVKDYQIAERDYSLAYADALARKENRDKLQAQFKLYIQDCEPVVAPNLDDNMVLYYVDEDGKFQQQYAGRVLTAGESANGQPGR